MWPVAVNRIDKIGRHALNIAQLNCSISLVEILHICDESFMPNIGSLSSVRICQFALLLPEHFPLPISALAQCLINADW